MENLVIPIENEMQKSYIDYAMSVIIGRALPDARDGLKPAQRRILYAMYRLNNSHDQQTKKSARIVGEVIGKYHPHGDAAAYETLVRMAQDFSMNYMLVEGQGNMGSIDGDPPAAQRYTEVRLRRIAEEMLEDLDKESVPFVPNFDNTEREPLVLPSKIPNLIINGSSGIAVGVATNILPHNLNEICDSILAYVDNHDITSEELLNYVKGPDFPTGGIVFNTDELRRSYLTGRGSVIIRSKHHVETSGNKNTIIVTEIPYTVNKAAMIKKMGELVRDKVITSISGVRDESDKKGIRIVIEIKKDVEPDFVMNLLYKHTQLQISLPVMNIAVMGNRLLTLNLRNFIKIFVDHRISVIKNVTAYNLRIAQDRLHIVEGLLIAINSIDAIITLIRSADDTKSAKESIMDKYSLSDKQASAILDMKLSKLTNLEKSSLESESSTLKGNIDYYNKILSDESEIYKIIKEDTISIKTRYGRDRRTFIEENPGLTKIENEDLIKDEDNFIMLTKYGYIKRMSVDEYRLQNRGGKGVSSMSLKEGDYIISNIQSKSKDFMLLIADSGRLYWTKIYNIPTGNRYSTGKALVNLVNLEPDEHIINMINIRDFDDKFLVMVTKKGIVKKTKATLFSKPRKRGVRAMLLNKGDSISNVVLCDDDSSLMLITSNGISITFKVSDLRPLGRNSHGVRGIRLKGDDLVQSVLVLNNFEYVLTFTERGIGKLTKVSGYRMQKRGGRGLINIKITEKTGKVVRGLGLNIADEIMLTTYNGTSIKIKCSDIRITNRNASGVKLINLGKDSRVSTGIVI